MSKQFAAVKRRISREMLVMGDSDAFQHTRREMKLEMKEMLERNGLRPVSDFQWKTRMVGHLGDEFVSDEWTPGQSLREWASYVEVLLSLTAVEDDV